MLKKINFGPFLIMAAAALWAVDALIRTELTSTMSPYAIVFFEHLLGFIFLSPLLIIHFNNLKKLNILDWVTVLLIGIVASVMGTLLFTEALARSFALFDFATPIFLQKLQPIFVIFLSFIFLKEKLNLKFLLLVPLAFIGSYMISFGTGAVDLEIGGKETVFILAVGAAFCWAAGTVLGRRLTKKLHFGQITALRFLVAIPFSFIVPALFSLFWDYQFEVSSYSPAKLSFEEVARLLLIVFSTGAVAMLIYYRGLKTTPARIATFAELTFPIVTIFITTSELNPYGEPEKFLLAKAFGIVILILSILIISLENAEKSEQQK